MKKTRLLLCYLFIFTIFVSTISATAQSNNIHVVINGNPVNFTESTGYPYIDENYRTMVPLRITMESAGAAVGYDSEEQTAIVITEHDRIEVPIGTNILYNNNVKIHNDTNAVAKNGRTYLPIRAVLESAGYTVEWDVTTNSVIAYNFTFDENEFVPYSTSSISTLIDNVLSGNVVYINGQYYAAPEYVKMLATPQITYLGDDLNTAIYPQNNRFDLADGELVYQAKEWVSISDLQSIDIDFQVFSYDDNFSHKGFYSLGIVSSTVYEMPSLPNNFIESPYDGTFDGIQIKIENNELYFKQSDLISHGILNEEITEAVLLTPQ